MKFLRTAALCGLWMTSLALADIPQTKRLRPLDFSPFRRELSRLQPEQTVRLHGIVRGATIPQIQQKMAAGELSSEQLTLYFLERIRQNDDRLRGYIEVNPEALQEARAADRLRASGVVLGPLHGIPINLKDNIETTAPMHTSGGAEILLNYVPGSDAPLVTRLRKSGAVVLGKASLSELAGAVTTEPPGSNAVCGAGVNPYRAGLPVLGSSSGSGITTSAYLTMVSVGTETSGSLVHPAMANGVVGMKPSLNLVSGEGVIPLIHFQDSPGPVARSVTDAAILLDALDSRSIDYAQGLRNDALQGVRAGLLPELAPAGPYRDRILAGLTRCSAVPVPIKQPLQGVNILESLILAMSYDTVPYLEKCGAPIHNLAELRTYNSARPQRRIPFGQNFLDVCALATGPLLQDYGVAESGAANLYEKLSLANRERAAQILNETFAREQVAVLVGYTFGISEYYATAGFPAITVPLGLDKDGAPIGLTMVGRQGDDANLLAYAYAFEQASRLRVDP